MTTWCAAIGCGRSDHAQLTPQALPGRPSTFRRAILPELLGSPSQRRGSLPAVGAAAWLYQQVGRRPCRLPGRPPLLRLRDPCHHRRPRHAAQRRPAPVLVAVELVGHVRILPLAQDRHARRRVRSTSAADIVMTRVAAVGEGWGAGRALPSPRQYRCLHLTRDSVGNWGFWR